MSHGIRVGVVSDTHGMLRAQALELLAGSDLIVHAGDVGDADVLATLMRIAPVRAVRGNVDRESWADDLPETLTLQAGGHWLHVLHDVGGLDIEPKAAGVSVVIHGHSHKPRNELVRGVLFFNPGSIGPRRFGLPITLGRLLISNDGVVGEHIEIAA